MVLSLKYKSRSSLVQLEDVMLEPELSQPQFYFQAEIVDSVLLAELFYRLHRVAGVKTGRQALTGVNVRTYNYDPIITINDGFVDFETFSLDMGVYAKVQLTEDAFQKIEHWDVGGVTNVDFSREFINGIRNSKKALKNMLIDPEGLEVHSDTFSLLEKKIPLPESWNEGLENIRTAIKDFQPDSAKKFRVFEKRVPLPKMFLRSFDKPDIAWQHPKGWKISTLNLRTDQGKLFIVNTDELEHRFDGRKNIDFKAVRSSRSLRRIKSLYLQVVKLSDTQYRVSGGAKSHLVEMSGSRYICDCGDFQHRGNSNCKHIQAVQLPRYEINTIMEKMWLVSDGKEEFSVSFENNSYSCPCKEFLEYNICPHVTEVMKAVDDYQFDETTFDLGKTRSRNLQ